MAEGMNCPHCGAYTAYDPVEAPKQVQLSQPGNWGRVFLASGSIYDSPSGYWYGLARCQACAQAFPVRGKASSPEHPDLSYDKSSLEPLWPTHYRTVPLEIPPPVRDAMEDASKALGAGSVVGSMLATRTAIVRAQREAKRELNLTEASLKALYEAGRISRFEFESSDLARRWANYLGHDEPEPDKQFTLEDAKEFYGYVESLLDTLYVKWTRLNKQRERLQGGGEAPPA